MDAPPHARFRKSESATFNAVLFASWIGYASENRPHPTSRCGKESRRDPAPAPVAYESPRAEYELGVDARIEREDVRLAKVSARKNRRTTPHRAIISTSSTDNPRCLEWPGRAVGRVIDENAFPTVSSCPTKKRRKELSPGCHHRFEMDDRRTFAILRNFAAVVTV